MELPSPSKYPPPSPQPLNELKTDLLKMITRIESLENDKQESKSTIDRILTTGETLIKEEMASFKDQVQSLLNTYQSKSLHLFSEFENDTRNVIKKTKETKLASFSPFEKTFTEKESHLIILFQQVPDFQSLYNMLAAIVLVLFIAFTIQDYMNFGIFYDPLVWGIVFRDYENAGYLGILFYLYSLLVVPGVIVIKKLQLKTRKLLVL